MFHIADIRSCRNNFERKQVRCHCRRRWAGRPFCSSSFIAERAESEGFREKENSRYARSVRRIFSRQGGDEEACSESQESRRDRRAPRVCRYYLSFHSFDQPKGSRVRVSIRGLYSRSPCLRESPRGYCAKSWRGYRHRSPSTLLPR